VPKENNWDATRITYEILAIWFGSVHATAITLTQALTDLCHHPEYLQPLRDEIASDEWTKLIKDARGMPRLDSFLKESSRLWAADGISVRRTALRDIILRDGTVVKKGEWICVPAQSIARDDTFFPLAKTFSGFRFADDDSLKDVDPKLGAVRQPEGATGLTQVSPGYHLWGTTRDACPGRFYASNVMKVILVHLLSNYEMELGPFSSFRHFAWRTYLLPNEHARIVFKPRN
jgi:cytochrome P450